MQNEQVVVLTVLLDNIVQHEVQNVQHVVISQRIQVIQVLELVVIVLGHVILVILKIQHEQHVILINVQLHDDVVKQIIDENV